jgi:hypothetical protein
MDMRRPFPAVVLAKLEDEFTRRAARLKIVGINRVARYG